MTGLGSGAPGRDSTTDEAPRRGFGWQILAILAIALVFRLMMAYGFDALRGSGFKSDLDLFRFWADNLGKQGPFGFYDRDFFADYTPGYLYALWLVTGIIALPIEVEYVEDDGVETVVEANATQIAAELRPWAELLSSFEV